MLEQQRHIDLHLPTSWNTCTTEELEHIAAAIVAAQLRVDRYHPFDWSKVKLQIVLAINGFTVENEEFAASEDTYMVKREQDKEAWPVTIGQLHALCERIDWIDDKKASKIIFRFPYPELSLNIDHSPLTIVGPPPLLDGYTWREYRWLTDWMQEYMRLGNAKRDASRAMQEFLAILFKPKEESGAAAHSMFNVHWSMFNGFSPIKWQVILFWWSSLMEQLEKKFPRVFKKQPVGKGNKQKRDTPWDFYNRVTATVQKYIGGLSATDVDSQPYSVTLQQLEMMADEAAEMEKIKHKK
jgi:hypothetical protein